MRCKQCNHEFEPKRSTARYCSDLCRKQANRDRVTVTPASNVTLTDTADVTLRTASLQDYYAHPKVYATRTAPELLNWGDHMTAHELSDKGLSANRVTIPGDWDYVGLCNI